jgi:hypothetical protein
MYEQLNLELYGREHAFLGAGRYGRCFSVTRKDSGEVFALKCVLTLSHAQLTKERHALVTNEFRMLAALHAVPGIVRVVDNSLTMIRERINEAEVDLGIGYLMSKVYTPIDKDECKRNAALRKKIGQSLVSFHSRNPPVYHGDARYICEFCGG